MTLKVAELRHPIDGELRRFGRAAVAAANAPKFWSASSPINLPIAANPVLDPNSAAIASVLTGSPVALSIVAFGTTVYYATPATPRVTAGAPGSGAGLELSMIGQWGANPLAGIPIPLDPAWVGAPGYVGESYRDGAMTIVDTDGRVFGLFQYVPGTPKKATWAGWQWGGPTESTITDQPGGNSTGAGFSRLAGVVRREELEAGVIDHALVFASRFVRPTTVLFPAKKTDGDYLVGDNAAATASNSIPEAQRIQLNPALDLASITGISKAELAIGRAAQKHGAYCIDNGGSSTGFQIICEVPTTPNGFTDAGNYAITINDPVYRAAGLTADGHRLTKIPWAGNVRVLKNWNGAA